MEKITASALTLLEQAPMTASGYLAAGIEEIDHRFGKGYAKAHPELLGVYMTTCAIDFATSVITSALQDIAETRQ